MTPGSWRNWAALRPSDRRSSMRGLTATGSNRSEVLVRVAAGGGRDPGPGGWRQGAVVADADGLRRRAAGDSGMGSGGRRVVMMVRRVGRGGYG
jgi:hypothetical protein